MVNEEYEPTEKEERVLEVLREEWRVNPYLIREETGIGKGDVNTALSNLRAAGWVRRVTRGLYEFIEDPRHRDDEQRGSPRSRRGGEPDGVDVEEHLRTLNYNRELTDERLEVLADFCRWVRDRGEPVSKGDYVEEFWNEERAERTGYNEGSFWEAFAKAAMKQSDRVVQPNARTYRWVGEDHAE